jgi:hypothetical protein
VADDGIGLAEKEHCAGVGIRQRVDGNLAQVEAIAGGEQKKREIPSTQLTTDNGRKHEGQSSR